MCRYHPSFYAHILNALLLILAVAVAIRHRSTIASMPKDKLVSLLLCASVAVGVHGLSHRGQESYGIML